MLPPAPPNNLLLSALPEEDYRKIAPRLEAVVMSVREVVCQPGEAMKYAFFPTSSMLSSIILLSNGTAVEAATIGNEGMASVGLLISDRASPYRVIQQVRGETLRIPVDRFEAFLEESQAMRDLMQRYVFTLLQQTGQNAACNLHHLLRQRMCRWLLQTSDRAGRHDFRITQEFLSEMLGVSRQTINQTARELQDLGLIEYRRGHVIVQNRSRMEQAACECYPIFNATYERYMNFPIQKPAS